VKRENALKMWYGMDFSDKSYVRLTLLQMVAFLVAYIISYKVFRRLIPSQGPEYCCRIITFLHGLIACSASIYYVVLPALNLSNGESSTSRHTFLPNETFMCFA
jgi:hypothetical protein